MSQVFWEKRQLLVSHTLRSWNEEVGRDSVCGREESHLMHIMKHSIWDCIIYVEYNWMFYVCHCMCILGRE